MGKYDGPSFFKKDHPKVEPINGKKEKKNLSKYELPETVRTREEIQQEAHDYIETPSRLNRRYRSAKRPHSLQYLEDWTQSRRNHELIAKLSDRLTIESSDYLLFEEYVETEPEPPKEPELDLLIVPEEEEQAVETAAESEIESDSESGSEPDTELEPERASEPINESAEETESEPSGKPEPENASAPAVKPEQQPATETGLPADTSSSNGVTLIKKDLVNLQFGQKKLAKKKKPVKKKTVRKKPPIAKEKKAEVIQEKIAAVKRKPNSGLQRSLANIIADDQKAMKQWNSNLDSLFSDEKKSKK